MVIQWHYTDIKEFLRLLSNTDPYHYIILTDDLLYIDDVPSLTHNYCLKRVNCLYVKEYLDKQPSFIKKLKENKDKIIYGTIDPSISLMGSEIYHDAIKFILNSPCIQEEDRSHLITIVNSDYGEYTREKKNRKDSKIEIP